MLSEMQIAYVTTIKDILTLLEQGNDRGLWIRLQTAPAEREMENGGLTSEQTIRLQAVSKLLRRLMQLQRFTIMDSQASTEVWIADELGGLINHRHRNCQSKFHCWC